MQDYEVILRSEPNTSFRCIAAANSQDIDVEKKLTHELRILGADVESDFNIGLILGSSGSGKTTLAKKIYGDEFEASILNPDEPIVNQFPKEYTYDECANSLTSIGLSSVPCWIRPVKTLSNGQKARAEAALRIAQNKEVAVIDEWTSVVDRTVGKIMSNAIQKHTRRFNKKVVLVSCHYDVVEWLNPDWIIDCNTQKFIDRRLLRRDFKRAETFQFDIRECDKSQWRNFSKYHYLSEKLPGGRLYTYGLYLGNEQIGFQCFANYVPTRSGKRKIMHSNRTVIHPDYVGIGLGLKFVNETSAIMKQKPDNYRIMAKFSNEAMYQSSKKSPLWVLRSVERFQTASGSMNRQSGFRQAVKTYSYEYVG